MIGGCGYEVMQRTIFVQAETDHCNQSRAPHNADIYCQHPSQEIQALSCHFIRLHRYKSGLLVSVSVVYTYTIAERDASLRSHTPLCEAAYCSHR